MNKNTSERRIYAALIAAVCLVSAGCSGNKPEPGTQAVTTVASEPEATQAAEPETTPKETKAEETTTKAAVTEVAYEAEKEPDTTEEAIIYLKEKIPNYGAFLEKRHTLPQTYIYRIGDTEYGVFIKDSLNMAMYSRSDSGDYTRVVYTPDMAYEINEKEKTVYTASFIESLIEAMVTANVIRISHGDATTYGYYCDQKEFNGKEYTYESIFSQGEEVTMVYSDIETGEVKYVKNGDTLTEVIAMTNEVTDESVFEIPADYEKKDFYAYEDEKMAEEAKAIEESKAAESAAQEAAVTGTTEASGSDGTKTVLWTAPEGTPYYMEDGEPYYDFGLTYHTIPVRLCTGTYYDSESDPGLFDADNFEFFGEKPDLGEYTMLEAGDTAGTLTVKEASMIAALMEDEAGNMTGVSQLSDELIFDGELTLTGTLRYYYDEAYTVMSGDIRFIPDSSYTGLPDPTMRFPEDGFARVGVTDFFEIGYEGERADGICVYSDAPEFRLGNLFENYSTGSDADAQVSRVIGNGKSNVSAQVRVTLTDVVLSWNADFGTRATATIASIEAV